MMNSTNNRIEVPYELDESFDVKQHVNDIQAKLLHLWKMTQDVKLFPWNHEKMARVDIVIDNICEAVNVLCDHYFVTQLYFRPMMVSTTSILLPNGWPVHLGMTASMLYMPCHDQKLALRDLLADAWIKGVFPVGPYWFSTVLYLVADSWGLVGGILDESLARRTRTKRDDFFHNCLWWFQRADTAWHPYLYGRL